MPEKDTARKAKKTRSANRGAASRRSTQRGGAAKRTRKAARRGAAKSVRRRAGGTKPTAKRARSAQSKRYWSRAVTEHSHALDLEPGVFKRSPERMARSLKRSAESSTRRKNSPYGTALSMLTFYENRAGKNLSAQQKRVIARAKKALRSLYNRPAPERSR